MQTRVTEGGARVLNEDAPRHTHSLVLTPAPRWKDNGQQFCRAQIPHLKDCGLEGQIFVQIPEWR